MKIVSSSQGAVFYADVERALTDAVKTDDAERDWLPGNDKQIRNINFDKDGDSWARSLKNLAKI